MENRTLRHNLAALLPLPFFGAGGVPSSILDAIEAQLPAAGGLCFKCDTEAGVFEQDTTYQEAGLLTLLVTWAANDVRTGNVDRTMGLLVSAPLAELVAPTKGRFSLYHIRMFVDPAVVPVDLGAQMRAGYYGVTGRPLWNRWLEHHDAGKNNTGYALHTAMHAAYTHNWGGAMEYRLCATAATLKEVYALEEAAVAAETLMPKGLNVIPGGAAGIKLLHQMRVTNNLKLSPEQRDALLTEMERTGRAGPKAHYRRGHVRQYADGLFTWVRACFVALTEDRAIT